MVLVAGLAYLVFVAATGLSLPCPIHFATGLACPGCGITRFFLALADGDIGAAWAANPALFFVAPPLFIYLLLDEYLFIRTGKGREMPRWLGICLIGGLLLFMIGRNLP